MNTALIASAALLGLAGMPHCAAMCAAPCAAVAGPRGVSLWAFLLARTAAYAAAGAVAAGSVGALAGWSQWSPALRPLWAAVHLGIAVLGLWMLWQGRQPAWMSVIGRAPAVADPAGWQPVRGPLRAAAAGGLWVAMPCGLLQSALLVASLAGSAGGGAAAMAGFALASSAGLVAAPWVWRRLQRAGGSAHWLEGTALVRTAGALLVLGSGFALGHGVWHQVAVFCGLA